MTDRYTKIVLTVIAAALTCIASEQLFSKAKADSTCGVDVPCKVIAVHPSLTTGGWTPCYKGDLPCYIVVSKPWKE
jgi:hypothetical protein